MGHTKLKPKQNLSTIVLGTMLMALVLAGYLFLIMPHYLEQSEDIPEEGISIDIAKMDKLYKLENGWKFIEGKFAKPSEIDFDGTLHAKTIAGKDLKLPGYWASNDNIHYGTLYYSIKFEGYYDQVSLVFEHLDTTWNLFANGLLVEGPPVAPINENEQQSLAAARPIVVDVQGNRLDLVLHISHFGPDRGGIWEVPKLGSSNAISKNKTLEMGIEVGTILSFLILSIFLLVFYIFRPNEKALLFLVLLAIILSIRHFFTSAHLAPVYISNLPLPFVQVVPPFLLIVGIYFFWRYARAIVDPPKSHVMAKFRAYGAPLAAAGILFGPISCIPYIITGYIIYETIFFASYMVLWLGYKKRKNTEVIFQTISVFILQISFTLEVIFNLGLGNKPSILTPITLLFFIVSGLVYSWKFINNFRKSIESTFELEKLVASKETTQEFLTGLVQEKTNDIRNALELAERANRAKSVFLANISHEMRTPLNGIAGFTELLRDNPDSPSREYFYKLVLGESARLLALIDQLLDLAKIEANKLVLEHEVFNLLEFLESIRTNMQMRCQSSGLLFVYDISNDLPKYIKGDPLRLRQVLDNLLSNALKFTEHGNITLHLHMSPLQHLEIFVQDTGIGIPSDRLAHIFDSFEQADPTITRLYGGSGLGTTIAKNLVELMKGTIICESGIGAGTTFRISIPIEVPHQVELPKEIATKFQSEPSWTDFPVMVVAEDYKVNAELVQRHLVDAGWIVKIAPNGQEALEYFKTEKPRAFILDIQMPIMDGITCAKKLRELGFKGPIIGLSANAFEEDKNNAVRAGMDILLAKPIKRVLLLKTVAEFSPPNVWINPKLENIDSRPLFLVQNRGGSLMQELDGDVSSLLHILKGFVDDIVHTLPQLREALEHDDFATIHRIAHRIKGGALNLGALKLEDLSKNLEFAAKQGNKFGIEYFVGPFERELRKIIHSAQLTLNARSTEVDDDSTHDE